MKREFNRAYKELLRIATKAGRHCSLEYIKNSWSDGPIYHAYIASSDTRVDDYIHVNSTISFDDAVRMAKEVLDEQAEEENDHEGT